VWRALLGSLNVRLIESALVCCCFLPIPVVCYELAEPLADAVVPESLESSRAVNRVIGLPEVHVHLEQRLLLYADVVLLEFCLGNCGAGTSFEDKSVEAVVVLHLCLDSVVNNSFDVLPGQFLVARCLVRLHLFLGAGQESTSEARVVSGMW
jgi:hypothetical protein